MTRIRILKVEIDILNAVDMADAHSNPRFLANDVDLPLDYAIGSLE